MLSRVLILFFAISVLCVKEGQTHFNNKDIPPPTTNVNTDSKDKVNQNPPDNFPYENATVVSSNSTLLNSNNNNHKINSTTLPANPISSSNVNQTDQKSVEEINDTQTTKIVNISSVNSTKSQAQNDTENIKAEDQKENSTINNVKPQESTTNGNANLSISNSSTIQPPKPTDTEVHDMLEGSVITLNETYVVNAPINESNVNAPENIVENIDDNRDNTEDVIRIEHPAHEENTAVVQGQLAAALAGVFVVISIIGYIGLISWRKYLENRYRDRQMLVDDMEFNEREDNLYFTI